MLSDDLLLSTVTNRIAFDQQDSKSISNFERAMDRRYWALVSFFWFPNRKPWIPSVLTNCIVESYIVYYFTGHPERQESLSSAEAFLQYRRKPREKKLRARRSSMLGVEQRASAEESEQE